ncbi:MAG: PRC-barrel domain-containing protein [Betaproteobacteria bacterium]
MEPGFDNGYWSDKHGPGPKVMAADTLQGDEVRNAAGEKLGELSHIMIDVPSGRVAYAVLSVGGFLGLGEKLLAIPWRALRIDTAKHGFTLDVSREKLDKAQGFDKDAWPSMADQSWAEGLHDYYGVHPYWR